MTVYDYCYNYLNNSYSFFYLIYSARCKQFNVVNGTIGRVKYIRNGIIMLENSACLIPVFPVFVNGQAYYPITAACSSTVHKVMGQDIEHVTLVFENKLLLAAVGYVKLRHVRNLQSIVPMLKLRRKTIFLTNKFPYFIITSNFA